MTTPATGVKYRIQNADMLTYIEALDRGTSDVRLRPAKESDFQYWRLEKVQGYDGFYYVRNVGNDKNCLYFNGTNVIASAPSTSYSLAKVWYENGVYRITLRYSNNLDYYVDPDDYGAYIKATNTKSDLDKQTWQLVPVPLRPLKPVYEGVLQSGNYRIRNINGKSLLTLPDPTSVGSANLYVRSQFDESDKLRAYQRWIVTQQESGQYTVQNAGDNSYLGCSLPSVVSGDQLVGLKTVYQWDFQSVGGFAWSLRIPTTRLSIGVLDNRIDNDEEMSLVPSDNTSSQMWFMENYIPLGKDEIHAKREVKEGKYLLQSARDLSIYMNAFNTPWRITPGSATTSKFNLKYVDEKSARFTLTLDGKNVLVADVGGYVGLNNDGTQFVLLEKDEGDPGYVLCRPDPGYPHKVVSGRTKIDANGNSVFSIDNKVAGEAVQMWLLVSK